MTSPEPTREVPALRRGNRIRLHSLLSISALFCWGCALCLATGRLGFMPLDQSIVFDGAWRLLSGQVPFRDFTTPDGLTPIVLQALFFRALDVTWFAYCLHAAVFNGLFCCMAYGLLRGIGAPRTAALLYGALSGVVFYPPFGTPFRDQHAFFFSLLVILMSVAATNRPRSSEATLLWILLPFALAMGYLSKQIPTVFVVPVVVAYLVLADRNHVAEAMKWIGVGTVLVLVALFLWAWTAGVNGELVRVYFFDLPAATGSERLGLFTNPRNLVINLLVNRGYSRHSDPGFDTFLVVGLLVPAWYASLAGGFRRMKRPLRRILLTSSTVPLLVAGMGGLVLADRWGYAWRLEEISLGLTLLTLSGIALAFGQGETIRNVRESLHRSFPALFLAAGMSLISVAFALFSSQGYENTLSLVFAALGVAQVCLMRLATTVTRQVGGPGRAWKISHRLIKALPWSLALLAIFQAQDFHRTVNLGRTVHDFQAPPSRDLGGSMVSPALDFLVWAVPGPARHGLSPLDHAESVRKTLAFFEERKGNFLLIGDTSILYALARRPSVPPSLWFHPGLTIPPEGSGAFERYERRLLEHMDRYAVRFVVLEGERTWVETRLSSFPALEEVVARRRVGEYRFGHFTIIELGG
jgi:hypothetical protein